MSQYAWLSTAMRDPLYHRAVSRDPDSMSDSLATECREANELGKPLGPDCFPKRFWLSDDEFGSAGPLGDMFIGGGFWLVSERCAKVFRAFDLGGGGLFEVDIFEQDRNNKVPGTYYAINFGSTKAAAVPEKSNRVRPPVSGIWRFRATIGDFDLAVDQAALPSADMWIDPQFLSSMFFSQKLGDALIEADLTGPFSAMKKCKII